MAPHTEHAVQHPARSASMEFAMEFALEFALDVSLSACAKERPNTVHLCLKPLVGKSKKDVGARPSLHTLLFSLHNHISDLTLTSTYFTRVARRHDHETESYTRLPRYII
jgi:hypothetical protein